MRTMENPSENMHKAPWAIHSDLVLAFRREGSSDAASAARAELGGGEEALSFSDISLYMPIKTNSSQQRTSLLRVKKVYYF